MIPIGKFPFWNQPAPQPGGVAPGAALAPAPRLKPVKRMFTIGQLRAGAPGRLPGYMQECLKRGRIDPVAAIITDATSITFTERDFQEIRKQYNPRTGVQTLKPGCC